MRGPSHPAPAPGTGGTGSQHSRCMYMPGWGKQRTSGRSWCRPGGGRTQTWLLGLEAGSASHDPTAGRTLKKESPPGCACARGRQSPCRSPPSPGEAGAGRGGASGAGRDRADHPSQHAANPCTLAALLATPAQPRPALQRPQPHSGPACLVVPLRPHWDDHPPARPELLHQDVWQCGGSCAAVQAQGARAGQR